MKVDHSIAELLYSNDFVIVPGFGGFVANPVGARVLRNSNTIFPPSKKIAFNARLSENDGLLVSFLSKKNNEPYSDSMQRIKSFSDRMFEEMESGQRVSIEKIGVVYYDNNRNIQFEADSQMNYLPASFGLTPVHAVQLEAKNGNDAVRQSRFAETTVSPVKSEMKSAPVVKSNRKLKRSTKKKALTLVSVFAVACFFVVLGLNFEKLTSRINSNESTADYSAYTDSFIEERTRAMNELNEKIKAALGNGNSPAKIETVKSTVANPVPDKSAAKENIVPEKTEPSNSGTAVIAKEPAENKKHYYIITGQFSVPENADKFVASLKEKGFDAEVAGTKDGLKLVSCYASDDRAEAKAKLKEIKSSLEKYAWLYEGN